jgi:hypothetical protein
MVAAGDIVAGSTLTLGVRADDGLPVDVGTILDWVEAAVPGDELHYCSGHIPRTAEGPKLVRRLYDLGLVEIFGRRTVPGVWHYIARRIAPSVPVSVSKRAPLDPGKAAARGEALLLLDMLRELAAEGRPCPTNSVLATLIGAQDGNRISYLFKLLRQWDEITVEPTAEQPRRRVTIVATGGSTSIQSERRAG